MLIGRANSATGEGEAFSKATAQPNNWLAESTQHCACGRGLPCRRMVLAVGDTLLVIVVAVAALGRHDNKVKRALEDLKQRKQLSA